MDLITQNPADVISEINSKLRSLESKNSLLAEHLLTVNQNSIEEYKRLGKEISSLNLEIKKLKEEMYNLKQALNGFLREIDFFAKKSDIKVLEKYINLWNPLDFVTEDEIDMIIEKKLLGKKLTRQSEKSLAKKEKENGDNINDQ